MAGEEGTVVYRVEPLEDDIHVELIIHHQCQSLVEGITGQLMMKSQGLGQDTDREVQEVAVRHVLGPVLGRVQDRLIVGESTSHQRSIVVIRNQRDMIRRSFFMLRGHLNIGLRMLLIIIQLLTLIIQLLIHNF